MICIQLIDRFLYGGAERVALTYQNTLNTLQGVTSFTWALQDSQRPAEKNVQLFRNHFIMFCQLLRQTCLSDKIFFCHTTRSLAICCILKILFRKRVKIVYIRHFQYTPVICKILMVLRHFIDKAILITPAEKKIAEQIFSKKLHYINNYITSDSIDDNRLHKDINLWANNRKIIAFAGGMKKGKHPVHLLELSKILGTEEYCYLYIGDGPERECVASFQEENKDFLQGAVFYCGFQNDVISILKNVHYFFFTSWNHYEMMPMVLLEALEAKCLCFAYNMEVNKHILPLEHLFDFKDFNSIAEAIRGQRIKPIPNPFNSQYGIKHLSNLLNSIR